MKLTSGQNDSLCIQRQANKQWGEIIAKGAFAIFQHSSSQQRLDQWFYVLTLNFEIPQVAYF